MPKTSADVRNAHTPRTPEAIEQIDDQLKHGHGVVETGDPTTSRNLSKEDAEIAEKAKRDAGMK